VNDLLEALGFGDNTQPTLGFKEMQNLSTEEKKIMDLLLEPLSRDEIIRQSKMSAQEINTILSILEIKGLIKENLGEIEATY